MSNSWKVGVVVALVMVVGAVVVLKQRGLPPDRSPLSVAKTGLPKLVDLGSTTCIPCKMMAPILESLKTEYAGRLAVEFIDVNVNPDAAKPYRIKLIPTQVFLDASGKERFRHEGFFAQEEILAKWKELGVDLTALTAKPASAESSVSAPTYERLQPAQADTRARERVCYMCDGDIPPENAVTVLAPKGEVRLCGLHCYFILYSCLLEDKADIEKVVAVTDRAGGKPTAAAQATYLYGMEAESGRPTIAAYADRAAAEAERRNAGGILLNWAQCLRCGCFATMLALLGVSAMAQEKELPKTIEVLYPGLLSGALSSAVPAELPPGVLVTLGKEDIRKETLDGIVAKSSADLREQLQRNTIFLADELATKRLLSRAASEAAQAKGAKLEGKSEPDIIADYLQGVTADVAVTDAEISDYYAQNRAMFEGASLDKVKDTLRLFLRKMKRQEIVDRHIRSLGGKFAVRISSVWLTEQAARAMDNPVDKARRSGKVTVADFGAESCQACQLMKPVLELLTKKYEGRANVLFVHVQKEPVLATRFGIRTIPVQVFFDNDGKEVLRHEGFYPQVDIEKKLAELGVQ